MVVNSYFSDRTDQCPVSADWLVRRERNEQSTVEVARQRILLALRCLLRGLGGRQNGCRDADVSQVEDVQQNGNLV